MNTTDTIAAISSAVGPAARMIVRLSGPHAQHIAREITPCGEIEPASATRCTLTPPGVPTHLYAFAAPRSYTGDDLVEFHIPGSPVVARMILDDLLRRGARHAEPGEFTARAYFNGRLDLTQAEGVAATIGAQSQREAQAARQLLAGELARRVSPLMDDIAQALALTEVGIDFADEDVTFISADQLAARCKAAVATIDAMLCESPRFVRLAHEPRIVLVGRPNAGKSTLLNALAGRQRAVVSNVAGTTRDALTAHVSLHRGMVQVIDVAGIDEAEGSEQRVASSEKGGDGAASIQRQMREHALRELETADHVVLVHDPTGALPPLSPNRTPDLVIHTKSDLPSHSSGADLSVSAKTGTNIQTLKARLDALAFGADRGAGTGGETSALALNTRHVRALEDARDALTRAAQAIPAGPELAALELRCALEALGRVIGQLSPDDLLGRIFSQFCIGK
jgi:tRNA modification GTPase